MRLVPRQSSPRLGSVSVEVDVDVNDILDGLSDDDIREIAQSRGLMPRTESGKDSPRQMMNDLSDDLRACLRAGDAQHLEVLILRIEQRMGLPKPQTSGLHGTAKPAALTHH